MRYNFSYTISQIKNGNKITEKVTETAEKLGDITRKLFTLAAAGYEIGGVHFNNIAVAK